MKIFLINFSLRFLRLGGGLGAKLARFALPVVQKLSKHFGKYFQPSEEKLRDKKFLVAHATFLLDAMTCGVVLVRELDKKAKNISLPDGTAVFEIEGMDVSYGLKISDGKIDLEKNVTKPDVKISFCDPRVIIEASQQKLDSMAAVGLGRVKISGLVPMADALELIMDRIGVYLTI